MRPADTNSDGSQLLPPFLFSSSASDSPPRPRSRQRSPEKSVMSQSQSQSQSHGSTRHVSDASPPFDMNQQDATSSPPRRSPGESHKTSQSDAENWFDHSNQNPAAILNSNVMDVDPPFFQKESDSSNEDKSSLDQQLPPPKSGHDHSSSADDYRSVIDDLTMEIQKLKEELKRYRQRGPDMLRSDKLFEIKIHGLPKEKKQELEATLRDFAANLGLDESPMASSPHLKKSSRQATRHHMFLESRSISASKHASSSSGSNIRQGDSAYASISTGANSVGNSLGRPPSTSRIGSSDRKVENYLRDIPKGLYPRHVAMTEKEKKRLVVRRLEQIFTGKISGRHARRSETIRELGFATSRWGATTAAAAAAAAAVTGAAIPVPTTVPAQTQFHNHASEPSREAQIIPFEQVSNSLTCKKAWSREVPSGSDSNGDCPENAGKSKHSGSASRMRTDASSAMPSLPEQRPTRLKDLDPDRVQIPAENMEYMRHLGLAPVEPVFPSSSDFGPDVHADADGWVYLNLLCNMAQLHIMNVTPDFVRTAVTELSVKFQLSPDGRKIRWRGGTEGTKFGSDSSGGNSQRSAETDDTEASGGGARKRRKIGRSTGDNVQASKSAKNLSSVRNPRPNSSERFHYQPLFIHKGSLSERVSTENDTWSSFGPAMNSHNGNLGWHRSGYLNASSERKRRHDGTIIYYSGAPFCTDLSGDPGDASPMASLLSSRQVWADSPAQAASLSFMRLESETESEAASESSMACRPLSDEALQLAASSGLERVVGGDDNSGETYWEFPWSNRQQLVDVRPLEPSGLGGVLPEDHFMVIVTTERPKHGPQFVKPERQWRSLSDEATGAMAGRLAALARSSRPLVPEKASGRMASFDIRYVSESIRHLKPERLPPAAMFLAAPSVDSWSEEEEDDIALEDDGDGFS